MPCFIGEGENQYYANIEATLILEKIGHNNFNKMTANKTLCDLCSKMSLAELKNKNIEEWYFKHLMKDGTANKSRTLNEILRLYGR